MQQAGGDDLLFNIVCVLLFAVRQKRYGFNVLTVAEDGLEGSNPA